MSPIAGILLAAGASSRFGSAKLLARLADGRPIGLASLQNLRGALADVRVVVRRGDLALRTLFEAERAAVVECDDAHLGMSRSLVAGVHACGDAAGWVIALGDMPFVSPVTIRAVADALRAGAQIALPVYHRRRGHPVGFGAGLKDKLLQVSGDEGARAVVRRNAGRLRLVDCDDPGILRDIDTPRDLEG